MMRRAAALLLALAVSLPVGAQESDIQRSPDEEASSETPDIPTLTPPPVALPLTLPVATALVSVKVDDPALAQVLEVEGGRWFSDEGVKRVSALVGEAVAAAEQERENARAAHIARLLAQERVEELEREVRPSFALPIALAAMSGLLLGVGATILISSAARQ